MNNYLSIITLNVNELNAPIKRHRIAEWIKKHDPHMCCLQENHLRTKHLHRLKVKGWEQILQANGQGKKEGVAIFISDKIDFKKRAIKRDPERLSIKIQGQIKSFPDKRSLKEYSSTEPALQQMLKGLL